MAVVEVSFSALPAHVRTARLVASAVARRSGVAESELDEVRFAVGEACLRAVHLHRRFVPTEQVRMEIVAESRRLTVTVIDAAPEGAWELDVMQEVMQEVGGSSRRHPARARSNVSWDAGPVTDTAGGFLHEGFGLAVIRGLVDDVEISAEPAGIGTRVTMSWPLVATSLPSRAEP
jgi:serine/threonine-protein kinase RsbW